jgi:hypothetical protein
MRWKHPVSFGAFNHHHIRAKSISLRRFRGVREIRGNECTENIGLPSFGRPNEVERLGKRGVPPKAIPSILRQDSQEFNNYHTTGREVYNELSPIPGRVSLRKKPKMQALIDVVSAGEYGIRLPQQTL